MILFIEKQQELIKKLPNEITTEKFGVITVDKQQAELTDLGDQYIVRFSAEVTYRKITETDKHNTLNVDETHECIAVSDTVPLDAKFKDIVDAINSMHDEAHKKLLAMGK